MSIADEPSKEEGRGYDAGLSIEPHRVVVFHDTLAKAGNDDATRQNFVEYGRRLEQMLGEIKRVAKPS